MAQSTESAPRVARGRKPGGAGRIPTRFTMVASREYMDWIAGLARHMGMVEMTDVAREAFKRTASATGYPQPPIR